MAKRAAGALGGAAGSAVAKRRAGAGGSGNGFKATTKATRKRAVEAGKSGGAAGTGDAKRRKGPGNGKTTLSKDNFRSWRPLTVRFEHFQHLLGELHRRREADPHRRQRPYLRLNRLPKALQREDLPAAVECMNTTCYCAPDRNKDPRRQKRTEQNQTNLEATNLEATKPDKLRSNKTKQEHQSERNKKEAC